MGSKVLIIFLLLACLISHTVSKQNANGDQNQLEANGDQNQLEANGDQNQLEANGDQNQLEANGDQNQQEANGDQNQLEANGDQNQLEANGDDDKGKVAGDEKEVLAEPSAIDPVTSERCCPKVMKPIVLTAKPRYKWIVVPPLSVT